MSDKQRPPAKFGSTVATKTEPPPSRRDTMSMGSVRKGQDPAHYIHDANARMAAPRAPAISPVEERTRVMRAPKDSAPPPTIAMPPMEGFDESGGASAIPGIEMVVVEERQLPGGERKPWRAAEVWTKRRVYALDSTYKCLEVLDRETGRAEVAHEMVGARLGGGRLREGDKVRFTYPLPLPGTEAMFMKAKKHGYTSPVERMVVRVRVLVTGADEVAPSWDEIASRWSDPPPRP